MESLVVLFFLHNIVATLVIGLKFKSQDNTAMKKFGYALLLNAIAYAIWSSAVILRPEALDSYITIGALFLAVSLVFFLSSSTKNKSIVSLGVIVIAAFFALRTLYWPSNPQFSEEGFLLFNVDPMVQMMYMFGLGVLVIPAINAVAEQFNSPSTALIVRYGFIIQVMGGLVLITNVDPTVLFIDGLIIGLTYLLLWTHLLFNKSAWS